MDVRVVAEDNYDDPIPEDRDEADRDEYNLDSDPNDDRDNGVDVAIGVSVRVAVRIAAGVGFQVAIIVTVFVVVPIVVLSVANDPYSIYPSLYISFAIGIGIVGRAVASD